MASVSAFSLSTHSSPLSLSPYPSSALSPLPCIKFQTQFKISAISSVVKFNKWRYLRFTEVRAVAEEEEETSALDDATAPDQTVSVAVSPSDVLTMFFQLTKLVNQANSCTSYRGGLKLGRDDTGFGLQVANVEFELRG